MHRWVEIRDERLSLAVLTSTLNRIKERQIDVYTWKRKEVGYCLSCVGGANVPDLKLSKTFFLNLDWKQPSRPSLLYAVREFKTLYCCWPCVVRSPTNVVSASVANGQEETERSDDKTLKPFFHTLLFRSGDILETIIQKAGKTIVDKFEWKGNGDQNLLVRIVRTWMKLRRCRLELERIEIFQLHSAEIVLMKWWLFFGRCNLKFHIRWPLKENFSSSSNWIGVVVSYKATE